MPPLTPEQALDLFDRRDFLKYMGASVALLSLEGCRNKLPPESLVPYAHAPEDRVLGRPQAYATSFPFVDFAQGLLVTSHEGRPTKIEGNPKHPASLGATSLFAQTAILDLYDPQRLTKARVKGHDTESAKELHDLLLISAKGFHESPNQGEGLCFLTERVNSPSLWQEFESLKKSLPKAQWFTWEPWNRDQVYAGTMQAFGEALEPIYDFKMAKTILSLDHDFLGTEPGIVAHARAFIDARSEASLGEPVGVESRPQLFVIEPTLSLTGAKADERWALSPTEIELFVSALESQILPSRTRKNEEPSQNPISQLATRLASALQKAESRSLIMIGSQYPAALQARVHGLNAHLNSIGQTIRFRPVIHSSHVNLAQSMNQLLEQINSGKIQTLIIDAGNPVFNLPSHYAFAKAIEKVPTKLHLTLFANETSAVCEWVMPRAHFLESWGDVETLSGETSLMQPLIAPLYASQTLSDLITLFASATAIPPDALVAQQSRVKNFWLKSLASTSPAAKSPTADDVWRQALKDGVWPLQKVREFSAKFRPPPKPEPETEPGTESTSVPITKAGPNFELVLRPDPTLWDGRFNENAWLQELPKPFTYLTWDNAVLISPAAANSLKLQDEDRIEIKTTQGLLRAPVLIMAGLPEKTLTLHLGFGRTKTSSVGEGTGVNAYPLVAATLPFSPEVLAVTKVAGQTRLARTQSQIAETRPDLFREGFTENKIKEKPDLDIGRARPTAAIGDASFKSEEYQWAMSINLESCIGCNSCVVACQSENNIPVVGKDQVLKGRVMQWIRIDRYQPEAAASQTELPKPQPVACMHCEKAPCEVVCPVAATNHSGEGLNQMVYNRCVGTRYCSNNCPYKVRRFNFYKYTDDKSETLKMQRNPDVTVRSRGVMEKCTYCVQRITAARIEAEKENRLVKDGEIRTACEASCPTRAIVFGNLLDPHSQVSLLKKDPRTYGILTDLGTRPRTTYVSAKKRVKLAPESKA